MSKLITRFLISFSARCLQQFKDILLRQASSFHTEDMVIDAHYVHKSDLTGQLSEEEVLQTILSFMSKIKTQFC